MPELTLFDNDIRTPDATNDTSPFDVIRRIRPDGTEYWSARDLQPTMGYPRWNEFKTSLERAMRAAENQGFDVADLFRRSTEKSGGRPAEDFELARGAAYLVAMNGDPNKRAVAAAQAYFAVKTREAEVQQFRLPRSFSEALLELAAQVEANEAAEQARIAAEARVAVLEPKSEAFDVFLSTSDGYSVRDAATCLSRDHHIMIGEKRLRTWLFEHGWIYRAPDGAPRAYQPFIERGLLDHRSQYHFHPQTGVRVTDPPQVRVTAKGMERLRHDLPATQAVPEVA